MHVMQNIITSHVSVMWLVFVFLTVCVTFSNDCIFVDITYADI